MTGTVTYAAGIAGPPDGPGPARWFWAVTVRVEKIREGKHSRREFFFRTYRPGYTVGHRYTIEARRIGDHYEENESSPIKEEAYEAL